VTEVFLLLLALGLTLVCAVFVAAEFSLTTVERGGITVSSLVLGAVAEPAPAADPASTAV
jgi:hypothetical protein